MRTRLLHKRRNGEAAQSRIGALCINSVQHFNRSRLHGSGRFERQPDAADV